MLAHCASPGICVDGEGVYWGETVEGGGCTEGDSECPLNHSYGGTGGGVWGPLQSTVHTAAARLSCMQKGRGWH